MFKKLICIALTLIMVLGLTVTSVSAQQMAEKEEVRSAFVEYAIEEMPSENLQWIRENAFIVNLTYENGWTIFYGYTFYQPLNIFERIGNYIFTTSVLHPYQLGLYGYKDGKVEQLNVLYTTGEIHDVMAVADAIEKSKGLVYSRPVTFCGDVDLDKKLTIKDTLWIQKVLADIKLTYDYYTYHEYTCDYNLDEEITVSDVLGIQKALANIV